MLFALVCFPDNKTEIIAGVSCGLGFLAILLVTNLVRYFSVFVMNLSEPYSLFQGGGICSFLCHSC